MKKIADLKIPFDNKWITIEEFATKGKLSIPTDEEIEEKAKQYCKANTHIAKRIWYFASKNFTAGYKQALKDLDHIKQ